MEKQSGNCDRKEWVGKTTVDKNKKYQEGNTDMGWRRGGIPGRRGIETGVVVPVVVC